MSAPHTTAARTVKGILSRYGFRRDDFTVRTQSIGACAVFANAETDLSKAARCLQSSGLVVEVERGYLWVQA